MNPAQLKAAIEKNMQATANIVHQAAHCFPFFLPSLDSLAQASAFVDFLWLREWDPEVDAISLYQPYLAETGMFI